MKSIIVVTNIYPNSLEKNRGIFIKQLVEELLEFYNIKVIAPVPWFPKFLSFLRSDNTDLPYKEMIDGIEVFHPRYLVIPKIGRSLYGFSLFLSLFVLFRHLKKTTKIDLISGHWVYPDGFAAVLCAKILNIKISLHALGCDINEFSKYYFRRLMIRFALNHSDINIVKSDELREKVISLGVPGEKTKVITNGVNKHIFKPQEMSQCRERLKWPTDIKIILFIGNFQVEKGLEYLIKAYHILRQEIDNVSLYIVGCGYLEKKLRNFVRKLDLYDGVKFIGRVRYEDIPLYLNACDIVCLPSLREGNPNVVIEALSCDKQVVASRVGSVPDIITSDDLGIMVNPADYKDLSNGLKTALRKDWSRVHKFSWMSWRDNALRVSEEFNKVM